MNRFTDIYNEKKKSAVELAKLFESGWVCASDLGVSVPYGIYGAVEDRVKGGSLSDITMHTILDTAPLGCYGPELSGSIHGVSWFSGAFARKGINSGYGDVMPCYYRDIPALMEEYIDIDAYCALVSPMDEDGYFATFNGSCGEALLRKGKRVFLEVNKNVPRTYGSVRIHISQVFALCESEAPIPALPRKKPDEVSTIIGNYIADEVPDGATLQLGIGSIPEAVGLALMGKHNLGIHTEMFTDSMVDLIKCGAVDNSGKSIHKGKSVAAFALGSGELYSFLDNNPDVELLPVSYTNDPAVISKNPRMISVNAAMEVDFMGQVCAESVGSRHHSGTGGQNDFVRGAVESEGGKSFIAFPSTAKGGSVSRIKPVLTPGSAVSTGKNDVDYIVTEYGIAKLRGRTLSQRTKNLISIAHPDFRDELTFKARQMNILV